MLLWNSRQMSGAFEMGDLRAAERHYRSARHHGDVLSSGAYGKPGHALEGLLESIDINYALGRVSPAVVCRDPATMIFLHAYHAALPNELAGVAKRHRGSEPGPEELISAGVSAYRRANDICPIFEDRVEFNMWVGNIERGTRAAGDDYSEIMMRAYREVAKIVGTLE